MLTTFFASALLVGTNRPVATADSEYAIRMKSAPAICASFCATSLSTCALMSCLRSLEKSGMVFPSKVGKPTSRRSPASTWNSSLAANVPALTTVQSFESRVSIPPTIVLSCLPIRSDELALFQPCSDPPKLLAETETTAIDLPLCCSPRLPMVPPARAADERARHRMASENLRILESLDDAEECRAQYRTLPTRSSLTGVSTR